MSHSATWNMLEAISAGDSLIDRHLATWEQLRQADVKEWRGRLPLVAELVDVLPPERCVGDPWHVPGQWGLILGRKWLVEPVAVSGGVGFWTPIWCAHCGHIQADSQGEACKRCSSPDMRRKTERPELKVIREVTV